MTGTSTRFCLVCGLLLSLMAGGGYAQTGSGTVTGTVRDSQKAVINNASVTLINRATNITRKTARNEEGSYHFGSVPLGRLRDCRRGVRVQEMGEPAGPSSRTKCRD